MFSPTLQCWSLSAFLLISGHAIAAPIVIPGTVTGIWTQPVGVTVIGGNQLSDGGSPVSMLTYNGAALTTGAAPVSLGTLVAVNSANYGVENANAYLSLTLTFGNSAGPGHSLVIPVKYHATLNVGPAVQQADTWTLLGLPTLAFEEGEYEYLVQFLGFGSLSGGGFGDATHFSIYEGMTAQASLMANVTVSPVSHHPEPASLAVWSLLLAGGYGVFRRSRKVRAKV